MHPQEGRNIEAYTLYRQFIPWMLERNVRQQDDDEWRTLLSRLPNGSISTEDYKLLCSRSMENLRASGEFDDFKDAIRLFPTNKAVNMANLQELVSLGEPIVRIEATYVGRGVKKATANKAMCLPRFLFLSRGARVMLRHNLWTEAGLVNGAMGTVHDIIYKPDTRPGTLPAVVLVKFDNYTGPSCLESEERVVPICSRKSEWFVRGMQKSRTQLPLNLAWAMTIHKSQGSTLDKAVIDVGKSEKCSGLAYVALSRVKTSKGIALVSYPMDRFTTKIRTSLMGLRIKEEARMAGLFFGKYGPVLQG